MKWTPLQTLSLNLFNVFPVAIQIKLVNYDTVDD